MKNGKALDLENIVVGLFRDFGEPIFLKLGSLIKTCLNQCQISNDWKKNC